MDLGYIEFDNDIDAQIFWSYLGAPPLAQRGGEGAGLFGKLFQVTAFKGQRCHALKIRKQAIDYDLPNEKLPPPLLSAGRFKCRWQKLNEKIICHLRFVPWAPLKLNPSRALNHRFSELTAQEPLPWEQCIFSKNPDLVLRGLDGNDNVVPEGISQEKYRKTETRYIQCIAEALIDEINRAFMTATGTPDFPQGSEGSGSPFRCASVRLYEASLHEVESYWEMRVPCATTFMSQRRQAFLAFGNDTRVREPNDHSDEESLKGNSLSVLIRLGGGESLRIYAKTTDRIRFEVVHRPKLQNNLLSDGPVYDVEGILNQIGKLKTRAASSMNKLLQYLENWSETSPQEIAGTDLFAARWFGMLRFNPETRALYEILKRYGRIAGGSALTQAQKYVMRKASKAKLVRYENNAYYPSRV